MGKLTVQFDTRRFLGRVERSVVLRTDDPLQPSVTLRLSAQVVASAVVLPAAQIILPSPTTLARHGRLVVRKDPSESGELRIGEVTTSAPWLTATARAVLNAEPATQALPVSLQPGDWILELQLAEDAPLGRSEQSVTFTTGLPREAKMSIPVRVQIAEPISVRPAALDLHARGAGEAKGRLMVSVRPDMIDERLSVELQPGPFQVVVERSMDRRYTLTVTWKAGENAEPVTATDLKLSLGSTVVVVPVRVHEAG